MICEKCKNKKEENFIYRRVLGDGICNKHGRYSFYNLSDKNCKRCHKEKCEEQNICEKCGKKLENEKQT